MKRHSIIPAVFLFLEKGEKIFLIRRQNTGHHDGEYGLPSGHLDGNESILSAAIREAREEVGITIKKENLQLVHVLSNNADDAERVNFFFRVISFEGEPKNCEPDKCDDARWFDKNNLPENTIDYLRQVIELSGKGILYSEFNW